MRNIPVLATEKGLYQIVELKISENTGAQKKNLKSTTGCLVFKFQVLQIKNSVLI